MGLGDRLWGGGGHCVMRIGPARGGGGHFRVRTIFT